MEVKFKISTNKSDTIFLLPAVGITINYKAFTIHMAMWNYVLNIEVEYKHTASLHKKIN